MPARTHHGGLPRRALRLRRRGRLLERGRDASLDLQHKGLDVQCCHCKQDEKQQIIVQFQSNTWRKYSCPKGVVTPKGRRSHTATVFQDSMYIYGGYQDLKGSSPELWAFHFGEKMECISRNLFLCNYFLLSRFRERDVAPRVPGRGGGRPPAQAPPHRRPPRLRHVGFRRDD